MAIIGCSGEVRLLTPWGSQHFIGAITDARHKSCCSLGADHVLICESVQVLLLSIAKARKPAMNESPERDQAVVVGSGDWRTNILPLLFSFGLVSFVTALLLLIEQAIGASLVPIAYLI